MKGKATFETSEFFITVRPKFPHPDMTYHQHFMLVNIEDLVEMSYKIEDLAKESASDVLKKL